MGLILEFNEFRDRESRSRTKSLSDEEFLSVFKMSCTNFSFDNDQLWRKTNNFGNFGLFFEAERGSTIGVFSYKNFFEERKDYLVPRYKSLIGSTTSEGAETFGLDSKLYLVIPFDDSNIIFAGCPDLVFWSKAGQEFSDDLFVLEQYSKGFKIPKKELDYILYGSPFTSNMLSKIESLNLGFEFFTNGNCLLLDTNKIEWLKDNI